MINTPSELKKARKKHAQVKDKLTKLKENSPSLNGIFEEHKQTIISQKLQLEKAKKIEEALIIQLREKEEICQAKEAKTISLRKELENSIINWDTSLKFYKILYT